MKTQREIWRAATRTCESCGKVFGRTDKPGIIYGSFMKLRYCSHECAADALRLDPVENFWSKVEKGPGCWRWRGGISPKGYGVHWIGKGHKRAHRYSYQLATGNDPGALEVMHSCDNRACVNPAHLSLGTHQDNMDDMVRKGRNQVWRGENHPGARLSAADAIQIRHDTRTSRVIAADYGMSRSTILAIKSRRLWSHL